MTRATDALRRLPSVDGHSVRFVAWEVPAQIWGNRWMRAVLGSVPAQLVLNYLIRPLCLCGVFWLLPIGLWDAGWLARGVTFLGTAFLVNAGSFVVSALLVATMQSW